VADSAAEADAEVAQALARAWWRRVPRVLSAPRSVFEALADRDELDLEARSEPVLALAILAGIAGILLTPAWGGLQDDITVDTLVVVVLTFLGGIFYGTAGLYLLGLALWLGAKGVGVDAPYRTARHVLAFAAAPFACSLVVTVPAIVLGFGSDWFRTGGDDGGAGRAAVVAVGLVFGAWSVGLVALGLRTTFGLPWRGVVGALALAAVLVAAFAVVPSVV
jgi:hypothetical protein